MLLVADHSGADKEGRRRRSATRDGQAALVPPHSKSVDHAGDASFMLRPAAGAQGQAIGDAIGLKEGDAVGALHDRTPDWATSTAGRNGWPKLSATPAGTATTRPCK